MLAVGVSHMRELLLGNVGILKGFCCLNILAPARRSFIIRPQQNICVVTVIKTCGKNFIFIFIFFGGGGGGGGHCAPLRGN